jgi:hypothetical protein
VTAQQATAAAQADIDPMPHWARDLRTGLPDLFYADKNRFQSRPDHGGRIARSVDAASLVAVDWDLARRRILAALLAEGPYSAASFLEVDFWRRKAVSGSLGRAATALYQNDMDAVAKHSEDLSEISLEGLPVWSSAAINAVNFAADGAVVPVIELVLGAGLAKCEKTRGEGAAIAVCLLATAWMAKVIEDALDISIVPQPR